jgi:hypothetical protein
MNGQLRDRLRHQQLALYTVSGDTQIIWQEMLMVEFTVTPEGTEKTH